MEVGEREIIYLSLHCHNQNDFCIKMGGDESHFNVSAASDGQSHKSDSVTLTCDAYMSYINEQHAFTD